ncbi:hypothetical protein C1H76_5911 [Elsinoe australis]|uniref:Uncharacterized protein n=1 Tax=Elsinoe australis TaxID=40998 RepID=A0A4U7AUB3_9PEZI|nr:hypothetical protein C1H76_5911 [Elsinoe australis]
MSPEPPQSPPPLDVSTQRHRRHFGAYLRKFGAVIRKKTGDDDLSHATTDNRSEEASTASGHARISVDHESRRSTHSPSVGSVERSSIASRRQSSVRSNPRSLESRYSVMTGMSIVSNVDRQAARHERAQFLMDKYGLSMSSDFPPERNQALRSSTEPLQRIQKRTRLRMHAFCHECKTPFGAGSYCTKCKHRRCQLCPRAAPKGVQHLVEQTKKQLDSISEPTATIDLKNLRVNESQYDYAKTSPVISVDSTRSSSRSPLEKIKTKSIPNSDMDLPESPRTMESVLAARDPTIPRPLSVNMHIDSDERFGRQPIQTRDLCYTLEVATAKLCAFYLWLPLSPTFRHPAQQIRKEGFFDVQVTETKNDKGSTYTSFNAFSPYPSASFRLWQASLDSNEFSDYHEPKYEYHVPDVGSPYQEGPARVESA